MNVQNIFTAAAESVNHVLKDMYPPFTVHFERLFEVFWGQCWQQSVQYRVSFPLIFIGFSSKHYLLRDSHRKKSGGVGLRFGDLGGQRPRPTVTSLTKDILQWSSCFRSVGRRLIMLKSAIPMSTLSDVGHVSSRKHFLCPEMFFQSSNCCFIWHLLGYALLNP